MDPSHNDQDNKKISSEGSKLISPGKKDVSKTLSQEEKEQLQLQMKKASNPSEFDNIYHQVELYPMDILYMPLILSENQDLLKYFITKNPNLNLTSLIETSIYCNKIEMAQVIIKTGFHLNNHLLNLATSYRKLDWVKLFVENDSDVHDDQDYVLALAACSGSLDVFEYLINQGCNLHTQDELPFRLACNNGRKEIIQYCIDHGVNIHIRDNEGIKWAKEKGLEDIVTFLQKH